MNIKNEWLQIETLDFITCDIHKLRAANNKVVVIFALSNALIIHEENSKENTYLINVLSANKDFS